MKNSAEVPIFVAPNDRPTSNTGGVQLGTMHAHSFATDPKHLGFVHARYHFVARMLRSYARVLEVGCGDCSFAPVVQDVVKFWGGIDLEKPASLFAIQHDIVKQPFGVNWDAVYALDVLEHVKATDEDRFFKNINANLMPHGTVIIGSPSLESQIYASDLSRRHHVNCKTAPQMLETLSRHYHNVFLFGMQDMTLHTGYDQMVHYRLGLCTGKR